MLAFTRMTYQPTGDAGIGSYRVFNGMVLRNTWKTLRKPSFLPGDGLVAVGSFAIHCGYMLGMASKASIFACQRQYHIHDVSLVGMIV